jgi:hypothetical protein
MFNPLVYHRGDAITPKEGLCCREERRDASPLPTRNARSCLQSTRLRKAWQPRPRLRAGPVVRPRHTGGRHAHQAGATGCRSLGSAWPTVSRSGRRIASARRSRGGNRGTLGGIGGTPPGASGGRTPPGSPQTVAVVALRPWCPFRLALDLCGQQPTLSRHLARHQSASRQGASAVLHVVCTPALHQRS